MELDIVSIVDMQLDIVHIIDMGLDIAHTVLLISNWILPVLFV